MALLWRSALSGMAAVSRELRRRARDLPRSHTAPAGAGESRAGRCRRTGRDRRGVAAGRRACTGAAEGSLASPGYSVTALATYGLLALMLSSDTLIAKHYLSNHQAGLYAGVSLTGKIAYFAASSLFVVAFPLFSRHHDKGTGSGKWILAAGWTGLRGHGGDCGVFALEPAWVVIPLLGEPLPGCGELRPVDGRGLRSLCSRLPGVHLPARPQAPRYHCRASVALVVQFAGFFAFHSTMTRLMGVLAVAFGVLLTVELLSSRSAEKG